MVKKESGALILELLVGIAVFTLAIAAILKLELKAISRHTETLRSWDAEARQFDWSIEGLRNADCSSRSTISGEKITRCISSTQSRDFNLIVISE